MSNQNDSPTPIPNPEAVIQTLSTELRRLQRANGELRTLVWKLEEDMRRVQSNARSVIRDLHRENAGLRAQSTRDGLEIQAAYRDRQTVLEIITLIGKRMVAIGKRMVAMDRQQTEDRIFRRSKRRRKSYMESVDGRVRESMKRVISSPFAPSDPSEPSPDIDPEEDNADGNNE